jgi:hypothetical protein
MMCRFTRKEYAVGRQAKWLINDGNGVKYVPNCVALPRGHSLLKTEDTNTFFGFVLFLMCSCCRYMRAHGKLTEKNCIRGSQFKEPEATEA